MSNNPWNGATVTFTNVQSNTVMDLTGSNSADGTPIIGYHGTGNPNQQWKLVQSGQKDIWPIFKIKNVATGTYIDLYQGGTSENTPINGWQGSDTDTNPHQLWRICGGDPGARLVKIQNYGTGTFVDLYHSDPADKTPVAGWSGTATDGNTHQIWRMTKV